MQVDQKLAWKSRVLLNKITNNAFNTFSCGNCVVRTHKPSSTPLWQKTDDRQHHVKRSPLTTKVSLLEGRKHENREENLPLLDGKYIGKMLKNHTPTIELITDVFIIDTEWCTKPDYSKLVKNLDCLQLWIQLTVALLHSAVSWGLKR